MTTNTKIEWCDHTFNPWEGCQKISPGCDNCYAEARNARFSGGVPVNWGPGASRRRTSAANWRQPLAWNANHEAFFAEHGHRQRVFCASLADVFDNAVDPQWLSDLFELIRRTPNLDWLLLTKRIGNWKTRMQAVHDHLSARRSPTPKPRSVSDEESDAMNWVDAWIRNDVDPIPANVWLGATIINQEEADRDIPKLLSVPAAKRFLSMEPLLGHVHLDGLNGHVEALAGWWRKVDWVIVGGESGRFARPMNPAWVRSLRDQCGIAGVPFFFKQWGEWAPDKEHKCTHPAQGYSFRDAWVDRVGKKAAGRFLDERTWDEFPREVRA